MVNSKSGGPAFPFAGVGSGIPLTRGMSIRDYFAGQAMINLWPDPQWSDENIAKQAYKIADAMIKEGGNNAG